MSNRTRTKPRIVEDQAVSHIARKRRSVRIVVPDEGPTANAAAMEVVADRVLRRWRGPDVVVVFAYRAGDDPAQAFAVGRLFASNDGKNWRGESVPDKRWRELTLRNPIPITP